MNKNVLVITQARMNSTRLPGKVLLEAGGKTLLEWHLGRLQWASSSIVVATTDHSNDDPIEKFLSARNLKFYRGSEKNVLSRYYNAALINKAEVIVRVTSDCPLIDGELIREGIESFISKGDKSIYFSNCDKRTFPRGMDFEIFSFESLEDAYTNAHSDEDLEHVTPYIRRKAKLMSKSFDYISDRDSSSLRLTIDQKEDFELVKILIEQYSAGDLRYHDILKIFDSNPSLAKINQMVEQKKLTI